jgi:energy-converting hydrogenase Eha subunit G
MRRFSREALLVYAIMLAAAAAFVIGHIAYVDLGFSRGEIRTSALGGAAVLAALLLVGSVGRPRDQ